MDMELYKLEGDIKQAIAWGRPDNESVGMTPSMFIALLKRALKAIQELSNKEPT